jgi:hypothetical protein
MTPTCRNCRTSTTTYSTCAITRNCRTSTTTYRTCAITRNCRTSQCIESAKYGKYRSTTNEYTTTSQCIESARYGKYRSTSNESIGDAAVSTTHRPRDRTTKTYDEAQSV